MCHLPSENPGQTSSCGSFKVRHDNCVLYCVKLHVQQRELLKSCPEVPSTGTQVASGNPSAFAPTGGHRLLQAPQSAPGVMRTGDASAAQAAQAPAGETMACAPTRCEGYLLP